MVTASTANTAAYTVAGLTMTREVRYMLSKAPAVKVTAVFNKYYPDGKFYREEEAVYEAKLIDLSKQGAKLSSATVIPTGESIRLQLSIVELGIEFYLDGKVCWSKKETDESSLFGCALSARLPDGLFDRLAEGGRLDRRFDPRFDEEIELSAFWEFRGTQVPVTLSNYSRGGFCILTKHPIVAGQQLHLCVEEPEHCVVIASAQWQLEVTSGYLIGASYLDPRDFARIEKARGSSVPVQVA